MISKLVAIDIDGVLVRGNTVIQGAKNAIQLLQRNRIPHVFVSNGGGVLEAKKAADLGNKLNLDIRPSQIILSHTPLSDARLVSKYRDSRVLIVGSYPSCVNIARHYGYLNAVTIEDICRSQPLIYPLNKGNATLMNHSNEGPLPSVDAIMVFHDPVHWGLEMQILSDLLVHSNRSSIDESLITGDGSRKKQTIPLFTTNSDLAYTTEYPIPRFTQGAFVEAFKQLYRAFHQEELELCRYGKPYKVQYAYAEKLLLNEAMLLQRTKVTADTVGCMEALLSLSDRCTYFGIGDNPLSDIKGANNAGPHWQSILVRTGMFSNVELTNDATNPADAVCDDIGVAVEYILKYTHD